MYLIHKRLKHIMLQLKEWNKKHFGNIFEEKRVIENKMQVLNQALIKEGFNKDISDQEDKHYREWENLCKQEEIFWRQMSRVNGSKKESVTPSFFIEPPWPLELTIESLRSRMKQGYFRAPMRLSNLC